MHPPPVRRALPKLWVGRLAARGWSRRGRMEHPVQDSGVTDGFQGDRPENGQEGSVRLRHMAS
eukprot:scaffold5443_cov291-Pinguiococcus_pyrenoidosus.AAC.13